MTTPLYLGHQMPSLPNTGHKGLWFDRFFNQYDHSWTITKANPQQGLDEGKKRWIKTVVGPCGDNDLLHTACRRQEELCRRLGGQILECNTTWHFATGLGNPHPVENGFAWHPTLGVPYLTGAAVKGLLRAWVEKWLDVGGSNDDECQQTRLATLYRWFGSEDIDPKVRRDLRKGGFIPPGEGNASDTEAGMFIFFDAIPTVPVKLACDVMTPHYGEWYQSGGNIQNIDSEPSKVPADWHSPVPVPFLVVKKANFLFCIAPRRVPHDDAEKATLAKELAGAMQALTDALQYLGAGTKTATGYGRMEVDEAAMGKRAKAAEQAKMNELEPEERMRAEVASLNPEQLATMFGKNYNKTMGNKGDNWIPFVELVRTIHGKTIKSWATSPDKNRSKAFKKLSPSD